ncbi:hypothetical protein ACWD4L_35175 [Streptomyces sp. NPDC002596]
MDVPQSRRADGAPLATGRDHGALVTNVPAVPWQAAELRADRERLEDRGMHITAYLISAPDAVVRGEDGRDEAIEDI